MANMRAKMKVASVEKFGDSEKLRFNAVSKNDGYPSDGTDENNTFAKWTPQADLTITINNPDLIGQFIVGDVFYLDFTKTE